MQLLTSSTQFLWIRDTRDTAVIRAVWHRFFVHGTWPRSAIVPWTAGESRGSPGAPAAREEG